MQRPRFRPYWAAGPIGLAVLALAGIWMFRNLPGQPVHPDAQSVPAVLGVNPPPQWQEAAAQARRLLRERLVARRVPGLSVAVGAEGAVIWAEGFGWADAATRGPVTPETRFRIGTASTVLASAAAGALIEQGRLALEAEIQQWVPQFPRKQWPVTLRQLMAHTAGLGTDSGEDGPLLRQRCAQAVEAVARFAPDPLLFEPGTACRESKYGWILVSAAIGNAAGQPLPAFLRERLFQRAGMHHTGAESASEENPERVGEPEEDPPPFTILRHAVLEPLGLAQPRPRPAEAPAVLYLRGFGPRPLPRYSLHEMRVFNLSCYAGSMAFYSTPTDLVRFGLALHSGALLKPATVDLLLEPQRLASGAETGYGLGWKLGTAVIGGRSVRVAGRDGELLGQPVASFWLARDLGLVVAITANSPEADTAALAREVAGLFSPAAAR